MLEESYTQFAEPLVSNLAIWDLAFVPYYTRLLRLWDLHAEVHQVGVVDAIVRKFGRCAEVEELIFARVAETESQHGIEQLDDLYSFLLEQYGDFTSSDLY